MRLVLHDYGGYPFTLELAHALSGRGHEVHYVHAAGFKLPRADLDGGGLTSSDLHLVGIDPGSDGRSAAGLRRLLHERRYGGLIADAIADLKPDAVLSANTPLDAQARALNASRRSGAAFVFWMQDVYARAVGLLLRRRLGVGAVLIGRRFARLERQLLQRSDSVVTITDDFRPTLEQWGIPHERTVVIENWAPLQPASHPGAASAWARRHGLGDRPLIVYAGTLGRKHDPAVLVDLASGVPHATVVVAAEGAGSDRLGRTDRPNNLRLLPLQPAVDVPAMLGAADILLAVLDADAHEFSVPSKVLTYLAAGRSILAAVPSRNLAARTIAAAGAGIVIDPADHRGLVQAASDLLANPMGREEHGNLGRAYAEREFDIERKADQFEAVLERVVPRGHTGAPARADTAEAHP